MFTFYTFLKIHIHIKSQDKHRNISVIFLEVPNFPNIQKAIVQ